MRKLETSYVAALELLGRGQRQEALEALMELEMEALGSTPSASRIDRVWKHKLDVVRRALELTGPEILVPVIMLHHDAYQLYRNANQPILARHARDMASDLATYKAQTTKSDADKEFAGWVMTSFGASVLTLRTAGTSAGILRDALELSPNNPVALLGLAWAHEVHGEYLDATELLSRLVASDPSHAHGRLRLAVCERRLGNLESAKANFMKVLAQDSEPWIRSIARQELARLLISLKDLEGAEREARAAVEEFPEDQEAAILLASLCERLGRVSNADEIISGIGASAPGQPSARYIYDRQPDLDIESVRVTLHSMMDERLGVLISGLRWWGVGTEGQEGEEG